MSTSDSKGLGPYAESCRCCHNPGLRTSQRANQREAKRKSVRTFPLGNQRTGKSKALTQNRPLGRFEGRGPLRPRGGSLASYHQPAIHVFQHAQRKMWPGRPLQAIAIGKAPSSVGIVAELGTRHGARVPFRLLQNNPKKCTLNNGHASWLPYKNPAMVV